MSRRFCLVAEAAASSLWSRGSAGLRFWLRGAGGPGTVILSAAIGAAHLRELGAFSFGVNGTGPELGLGIEWRL